MKTMQWMPALLLAGFLCACGEEAPDSDLDAVIKSTKEATEEAMDEVAEMAEEVMDEASEMAEDAAEAADDAFEDE